MAKRPHGVEEQVVDQNSMAPFIDVTFQLLIFFMLTIRFKQEEGHLLSMLPKERGPVDSKVEEPDLFEVRIYLCADNSTHRFDQHIGVKESHQQTVAALKRADPKIGHVCHAWLELNYQQRGAQPLYETSQFPSKRLENKRTYEALAREAKALRDQLKAMHPNSKVPVMIDADGLVPWEHAFGFLNALQKIKVDEIHWAGNPRFDKYFGPN